MYSTAPELAQGIRGYQLSFHGVRRNYAEMQQKKTDEASQTLHNITICKVQVEQRVEIFIKELHQSVWLAKLDKLVKDANLFEQLREAGAHAHGTPYDLHDHQS